MNYSDTRILITGSNGFVGKALQKALLQQGACVYSFTRTNGETIERVDGSGHSMRLHGDILDMVSVREAVQVSEPEVVIHLAAQSHVGQSFSDPGATCSANCSGTTNLLEAIRGYGGDPILVFSGSADEYGLVISSHDQYNYLKDKRGLITPEPTRIPELPINENNPLRPVSPYGISKVYGDMLFRSFHQAYGMKTVVARSFNIEGKGRGESFVTSVLANQVAAFSQGKLGEISIGNVSVFRDFTHISDAVSGYQHLITSRGYGDVYNLGSMRMTSVLSFLLQALEAAGYTVHSLSNRDFSKTFSDPLIPDYQDFFGVSFEKTSLDAAFLSGEVDFTLHDEGLIISTDKGTIPVRFDPSRFRPSDNPFMLADTKKMQNLGYRSLVSIPEIAADQVNSYFGNNQ